MSVKRKSKAKSGKKQRKTGRQPKAGGGVVQESPPAPERIEFFRSAVGLMPDPEDPSPGAAVLVLDESMNETSRFCTCAESRKRTCRHQAALAAALYARRSAGQNRAFESGFASSSWFKAGQFMGDDQRTKASDVLFKTLHDPDGGFLAAFAPCGDLLFTYFSDGPDRMRLVERFEAFDATAERITRARLLKQMALLTLSDTERRVLDQGFNTRGMAFRETAWYWLAYHGYREFGPEVRFMPYIDAASGEFQIRGHDAGGRCVLSWTLPRSRVKHFLKAFGPYLTNDGGLSLEPVPLDLIFDVQLTAELDLKITPQIRRIQKSGEFELLDKLDLKRFQYGSLVFIQELNLLADMTEIQNLKGRFKKLEATVIERSRVPLFWSDHSEMFLEERFQVDDRLRGLNLMARYDRLHFKVLAMERDWCWLDVTYGFGSENISLKAILDARRSGTRFIGTAQGWIDCDALPIEDIQRQVDLSRYDEQKGALPLSRRQLLQIQALSPAPVEVDGEPAAARALEKLLTFTPPSALPDLAGRVGSLRPYQQCGAEWLWFLYQNGLGGLLCDDMGLGKTHQVMALMAAVLSLPENQGVFLVVCPTSVLSHWETKIAAHAPVLTAGVYHGADRKLADFLGAGRVLITSYGVLLRDIEQLSAVPFDLAVFDEIQNLKNPDTQSYQAADRIRAAVRIGLTGTPIENRLQELKALMDLTVAGFLGTDAHFCEKYAAPLEADPQHDRREELRRLIMPFTLRRLKSTVLAELPEKIEDLRFCRLSEDQVKLYRDAVEQRRQGVLQELLDERHQIPYIHIFALLTLLKQICDHPALIGDRCDYENYASGKWDLFKELLAEALAGGQKVVVYSQFVGMVDIIADYLSKIDLEHAVLTGQSRRRGEIIRRFNEDPACRVFIGSLKAGGTGIDLTAASVVIHYDRWWNAAREDQATDRVHRIGQNRGVQVFKLVTRGTLEEKVAAIIDRKKSLMNRIVQEDDPGLLKRFTRDELIDLLRPPPAEA